MNTDNKSADLRPWYRLHATSWIVLFIALAFFSVLNASGFIYCEQGEATPSSMNWRHGWPLTYLVRNTDWSMDESGWLAAGTTDEFEWPTDGPTDEDEFGVILNRPFKYKPNNMWQLSKDVRGFYPWALMIDVLAAVALAGIVAFGFEKRGRKSRLFSFSLKELVAGMCVVAIALGYWQYLRLKQRETVIVLKRISVRISVEHRFPEWLWEMLPREPIKLGDRVRQLSVSGMADPAEEMRHLAKLSDVQQLQFNSISATNIDAAAKSIGSMRQLVSLNLGWCGLTDAGVAELGKLTRLETLVLRSAITDEGLAHLARMSRLENLYLEGYSGTDAGLTSIGKLKRLKRLTIDSGDRGFTATSIAELAQLSHLESLDIQMKGQLSDPNPKKLSGQAERKRSMELLSKWDENLLPLVRLPQLKTLKLRAYRITDRGLEILAGFPALQSLTLNVADASDEGVAKLRAARPGLQINRE